jgi:polar amino acid transport system substrate-binding protein
VIPIKKLCLIIATCALAAVTAACGSSTSTSTSGTLDTAACAKGKLPTLTAGKLTVGTDNPAYDPYFLGPAGDVWKGQYNHDPYNDKGFESATAYAVAQELGYSKPNVVWAVTPFLKSFAPGPKNFDFYLAQVSYSAHRAEASDLSSSYYDVSQAVVALAGKPIDSATSIADLKQYKLGAQIGTTGYDYIKDTIQPSQSPQVYTTTNDALAGLKAGQVDGIVVDYPTAYYMANVQLDNGHLVGQFPPPTANAEHFSLVLAKGSPLTTCVNKALATLRSNGTLAKIQDQWLSKDAGAPVLK